jgi:hypothetical protein
MLHLAAAALERGDLHARIVVEMNMQRRQRQIVVAVKILHQPFRQIPRGVVVDIDQRRDALARWCGILGSLLQPGAGEIADDLGAVLVTARFRRRIDLGEQIVFDGDGDPLHGKFRLAQYDIYVVSSY